MNRRSPKMCFQGLDSFIICVFVVEFDLMQKFSKFAIVNTIIIRNFWNENCSIPSWVRKRITIWLLKGGVLTSLSGQFQIGIIWRKIVT